MSILVDAIKALMITQQCKRENLQDYVRQFKTACNILKSHIGGPLILTKFVASMKGYNKTNPKEVNNLIEQASAQFFAFFLLKNADQEKYK
jgi:Na+/citrate or Na+/malate symporter